MLERINLNRLHAAHRRNVQCVDDLLDQRQQIRPRGNDNGVRPVIPLNRQGVTHRRCLGNSHSLTLQMQPQSGHLPTDALTRRVIAVLVEDRLQHRQHLIDRGVLQPDDFYIGHKIFDVLVEVGNHALG